MKGPFPLLALASSLCLLSCATSPFLMKAEGQPALRSSGSELRDALVSSARNLLGRPPNAKVAVRGRNFILDCIGTVQASYWGAGIDITGNPGNFGGNGVSILYRNFEAKGHILKAGDRPLPGDVIFWDNTWDRNGNKNLEDDPLTHAGLVVEVSNDGTITYLHEDYAKGVVLAYMNLNHPDTYVGPEGKRLNTALFLGSWPGNPENPPHWLSGDLFRSLGDTEKIEAAYR